MCSNRALESDIGFFFFKYYKTILISFDQSKELKSMLKDKTSIEN